MAWLSLRSLTEKKLLDKALETMRVILSKPVFNEADFIREKNRTLAGLKHREESPGAIAGIEFYKALYKEHPYGHHMSGVIETVTGFSAEDIRSFYEQYYVASNAMVVIVGDIKKQQAMMMAESLVADLALGTKTTNLPQVDELKKGGNKHIEFPSTQTHVVSGLIGMHRKDEDYFSLYVGNHILGGSGLVSLLFGEVREKRGLAYSAYSYFSPFSRKGPFSMGLQTRNDQTTQAVDVMQKTLKDFVGKGISDEQLIAAKKNITGGFAMRFESNNKLTSYVAMIGFYQLPLDYLDKFQQKVDAVTVASIKDAFKRRVRPELIHTITVGASEE
jgi:zinc protease